MTKKRSAAKIAAAAEQQPHGRSSNSRSTRSTVRQEQQERQRLEQQDNLAAVRLQRAQDLTATPLLQALPLVLVSGCLYKHEIRSAALVSKKWKSIWVEAQHEIPEYCKVEIKIQGHEGWPDWVKNRRLENVLDSQEFARTIFQKLCDLKIAVEQTERKKQKIRDSLPKWGIDFVVIHLLIWGPRSRNNGGLCFTFSAKDGCYSQYKLRGWDVRLDNELILWTWEHFQKWKKIYNWQPLWECEIYPVAAAAAAAAAAEDDDVVDDAVVAMPEDHDVVVVVPHHQPPPLGHENID